MLMLAGWAFELDSGEAKEASSAALECWTGLGLGFRRGEGGERWYDPAEVTNFLKLAGLDGRDLFWGRAICQHRPPTGAGFGSDGRHAPFNGR